MSRNAAVFMLILLFGVESRRVRNDMVAAAAAAEEWKIPESNKETADGVGDLNTGSSVNPQYKKLASLLEVNEESTAADPMKSLGTMLVKEPSCGFNGPCRSPSARTAAAKKVLRHLPTRTNVPKLMASADELQAEISSADVVMFVTDTCPFCKKAEAALTEASIPFKRVLVGPFKPALVEKTGKSSVPSAWVKGTYVGGCNDGTESWHGVLPMLKSGKFAEMLK